MISSREEDDSRDTISEMALKSHKSPLDSEPEVRESLGLASPSGMVTRSSHRSRSQRHGSSMGPEPTGTAGGACIRAAGEGDASITSQLVARTIAGVIRNMIALPGRVAIGMGEPALYPTIFGYFDKS
jgi:hypothetical protein